EEQQKNISPKDYRFYLVDRFIKLATHIEKNAKECVECNNFKKDVEEVSANLADYLNSSKTNKIKYEAVNDKIIYHLNKTHNLRPKRYYAAFYSVLGIIAGVISGFALTYIIFGSISKIILFALLIGFLTGNYIGYRKDQNLKKNNLQL
ncbi:hypothetical protein ACFLQ9_01860, partial [Bacteroidota bacterium]